MMVSVILQKGFYLKYATFPNEFNGHARGIPNEPFITQGDVGLEEVVFDPWEAAVDGSFGDRMATFLNPALDPGPRFVGVGEPEEVEDDAEAVLFGQLKVFCVSLSTQGGFEGEGFLPLNGSLEILEEDSRSLNLSRGRIERGESGSNFVGVVKAEAVHLVGEVFFSEGCFSGTIGTTDKKEGRTLMHGREFNR